MGLLAAVLVSASLFLPAVGSAATASLSEAKSAIADEDYSRAVELLALASDAGNPEAKRRLADLYEHGHGLPYDYKKALKLYREAAAAGDALAIKKIAYCYAGGRGVERSTTTAALWFKNAFEPVRLAAERGDQDAIAALANDYSGGLGVAVNPTEAARWSEKHLAQALAAAQSGEARDQYALANDYHYFASGLTRDPAEGYKWYQRAAAQGFVPAMRALSFNMVRGFGCPKDSEGGWRLRQKLADLGDASALADIAYDYYEGQPGWAKDLPKAREFYLKAIEAGDAYSAYAAGNMLLKGGDGLKADELAANRLFFKAAKAGLGDAQLSLGQAYAKGVGVTKDNAEAYKWTLLASISGNSSASDDLTSYALKFTAAERAEGRKRADAFIPVALPSPTKKRAPSMARTLAAAPPTAATTPEPAIKLKESPDDFALIVGIEHYRGLPSADYAEADAQSVRERLLGLGFPERNIIALMGGQATRSSLQAYLEEWLPKNVTPHSRVFFYFSGHGSPDAKTGAAFLVPADGNPEFLKSTAYALKDLYAALDKLPARQIVVALDSCFSGAGGRSVLPKGVRPLVSKIDLGVAAGGRLLVFAAASGDQVSGGLDDQGHGAFTYYLLQGLGGAAQDASGAITAGGLAKFVQPKVADVARRHNRDQTPVLMGEPSAVLFQLK